MPNGKKRFFGKREPHPHLDIAIRGDFSDLETACDGVISQKRDPIRIKNSFYYFDLIKKVPYYSLFIMDHNACKFPLVKKVRDSLFIILYFRFSDSNNLDHVIISSENGTAIIKITDKPINQELITFLNNLPQVSVHLLLLNSPPSNLLLELGITTQFTEFLKENGNQEKFTTVFEHPSITVYRNLKTSQIRLAIISTFLFLPSLHWHISLQILKQLIHNLQNPFITQFQNVILTQK